MTELFELYKADRNCAKEKIRNMDTSRLLAELGDRCRRDGCA